jgi:hypothetical protein
VTAHCGLKLIFPNSEFRAERKKTTMPSSKKARGRERRAAKEVKAAEAEEIAARKEEQDLLEAQMQRLTIDNLLRKSGAVQQCRHGFELEDREERLCFEFSKRFQREYQYHMNNVENNMLPCVNAAIDALQKEEKFAEILNDTANMNMRDVISYFVAEGTQRILNGKEHIVSVNVFFAYILEQYIAAAWEKTEPRVDWLRRAAELQCCDMHILVSYLKKRIPCKCLDEKYKEVKSIPKTGLCSNLECTLPDRRVARKKMYTCTGCNISYYCSADCQKAHWPVHKKYCKMSVMEKAEFDAGAKENKGEAANGDNSVNSRD